MACTSITLDLPDPFATDALGQRLARTCGPGDTIFLTGQIGAGKSALARAFIRHHLGADTDVPSPTFTLVQTYETTEFEIWHADLYRLGDVSEAIELGLLEAMTDQVCLIEWPELLMHEAPRDRLEIELCVLGDGRQAQLTGLGSWAERLDHLKPDA